MLLMSLLLSVITLNPAMTPPSATGHVEGYITANSISPDSTCKPGAICASFKFNRNGCFFNNFEQQQRRNAARDRHHADRWERKPGLHLLDQ